MLNVLGSTGPTRAADRRILESGSAKDEGGFLDTEAYPKNPCPIQKTHGSGENRPKEVLIFVITFLKG